MLFILLLEKYHRMFDKHESYLYKSFQLSLKQEGHLYFMPNINRLYKISPLDFEEYYRSFQWNITIIWSQLKP